MSNLTPTQLVSTAFLLVEGRAATQSELNTYTSYINTNGTTAWLDLVGNYIKTSKTQATAVEKMVLDAYAVVEGKAPTAAELSSQVAFVLANGEAAFQGAVSSYIKTQAYTADAMAAKTWSSLGLDKTSITLQQTKDFLSSYGADKLGEATAAASNWMRQGTFEGQSAASKITLLAAKAALEVNIDTLAFKHADNAANTSQKTVTELITNNDAVVAAAAAAVAAAAAAAAAAAVTAAAAAVIAAAAATAATAITAAATTAAAAAFTLVESGGTVTLTGSSAHAFVYTMGGAATRAGGAVVASAGSLASGVDFTGSGYTGAQTIVGTSGNNTITTGGAADTITGGAGADIITGGAGIDTIVISQAAGGTTIANAVAYDLLSSANITDTMMAVIDLNLTTVQNLNVAGTNSIKILSGIESINASGQLNSSVSMALIAHVDGGGTLTGGAGDDYIRGTNTAGASSTAASTLVGGNGADYFRGGDKADVIFGGAATTGVTSVYSESAEGSLTSTNLFFLNLFTGGLVTTYKDTVFANANILEGRAEADILVGSTGKDVFFYQTQYTQNTDIIQNFKIGTDVVMVTNYLSGGDNVYLGSSGAVTAAEVLNGSSTAYLAGSNGWAYSVTTSTSGTLTYTDPLASTGFSISLIGIQGTGSGAGGAFAVNDFFYQG